MFQLDSYHPFSMCGLILTSGGILLGKFVHAYVLSCEDEIYCLYIVPVLHKHFVLASCVWMVNGVKWNLYALSQPNYW